MISKKVEDAINAQINHELTSFYSYLAMSTFLQATPYKGLAEWIRIQAEEEHKHAMKLCDYLTDRDGKVVLQAIAQPQTNYTSPLEVFEKSLAQECTVTDQINTLYEIAQSEKDYATLHFLGWFLKEQVEEEKSAREMVDRLKLARDHINALLRIDAQAAKRTE